MPLLLNNLFQITGVMFLINVDKKQYCDKICLLVKCLRLALIELENNNKKLRNRGKII